jgi:hypothetical protein
MDNIPEFEKDCETWFGIEAFPVEVKQKLHYLAYDKGHALGFSSIVSEYDDLVDLAFLCKQEFSV